MKLTKTSLLGIVGLVAALLTLNGNLIGISPYIIDSIISIATIIVLNIWPSDNTAKPILNYISVGSLLVAVAGYFLDKPEVLADGTLHYILPIVTLSAIKNSIVAIMRFIQTGSANASK